MVTKQEIKYRWCFWRVKCNNQGTNTWIKVRLTYLNVWQVWLMIFKTKQQHDAFNVHRQRNKVRLVSLGFKLHQPRFRWCIYKLKYLKNHRIKYSDSSNHQTRYHCCFLMLNCFRKCATNVFRRCKETKWVLHMYLELEKLKMSCEWGTERIETKNQKTADVFWG